jgi:peroxiredoxin
MRKIFFIALVFGAVACSQTPNYKINVNLEGAEGTIVLEQREAGIWVVKDSSEIIDGVAILEGMVEMPEMYYLSVKGQRNKMMLFVENSTITVDGKADSINVAKVTGSPVQDEYNMVTGKISETYMALYGEARDANTAGDTAKANKLMEKVNELYESTNTLQEDFVKNNPASYVTPFFLSRIQYSKEVDELDAMVSSLDPKLETSSIVISLKERITKLKTVAVGQIAPDFTQNDADGNPVKFSDVYSKNELTLLDFWAAWCGPCRAENPNVVAIYNDYNTKGFSVFGVSLDKTKEDWLKAIADDGLTWQHVSDLTYWNNAAAQLYAVNSIPSSLVVNKQGKIIAKNLRGDDLRAKVAELLD